MTVQEKIRKMNADKGRENRKNGEDFEIRCLMKVKRMTGCLNACRASGSRGLFDVIAMFPFCVKCIIIKKNGYIEPAEKRKIIKFMQKRSPAIFHIEIWYKDEQKRRIRKRYIRNEQDLA